MSGQNVELFQRDTATSIEPFQYQFGSYDYVQCDSLVSCDLLWR